MISLISSISKLSLSNTPTQSPSPSPSPSSSPVPIPKPKTPILSTLPADLLIHIFFYLTSPDIKSLFLTNPRIYTIWKEKAAKDANLQLPYVITCYPSALLLKTTQDLSPLNLDKHKCISEYDRAFGHARKMVQNQGLVERCCKRYREWLIRLLETRVYMTFEWTYQSKGKHWFIRCFYSVLVLVEMQRLEDGRERCEGFMAERKIEEVKEMRLMAHWLLNEEADAVLGLGIDVEPWKEGLELVLRGEEVKLMKGNR